MWDVYMKLFQNTGLDAGFPVPKAPVYPDDVPGLPLIPPPPPHFEHWGSAKTCAIESNRLAQ